MNHYTPFMMELFEGNLNAYGQFKEDGTVRADGKLKGSGVTHRGPLHPSLWDDHLEGKRQLGVVPINEDGKTKFGAIDIDDYDVNKEAINVKIVQYKLPVTMFRSKSGGVHLYIFCKELASAETMQTKLKEIASFLGHGNAEIFPKQTMIIKERGDVGQWINAPYFNLHATIRFAIRSEDNARMTMKEFLDYVSERRLTAKELEDFKTQIPESLPHGPPCLQFLCSQGFPEGTRNQGLFNIGVYAKKADPDNWRIKVEKYNQEFMQPPLSPKEVLATIAGLAKKDYNYACAKQPICQHCNLSLCRTRKYGVGQSSGLPTLNTLTKLKCEPPIWFVDVDNKRVQLTTEELQNPRLFQGRCLQSLSIMPILPKANEWAFVVQQLLEKVVEVEMPQEATPTGHVLNYLEEFCTSRSQEDENPDVLLRGMVYTKGGFHYFRFSDFLLFLERKRFNHFRMHQISSILRDHGCKQHGMNVRKGKFVNTYVIQSYTAPKVELTPPPQGSDIPY